MIRSVRGLGLSALIGITSAGAWLACSGDDSGAGPGQDAGKESGGGMDGTLADTGGHPDTGKVGETGTPDTGSPGAEAGGDDGGADTGTGSEGGSAEGGDGGAGSPNCTAYCSAIMQVCTMANAQYQSQAECLTACQFFPPGAATDTSGNTLGCRVYHTGLAATNVIPHCWHAGPFGYGACGDQCGDFCMLATSYCAPDAGYMGDAAPYSSPDACAAACPTFPVVAGSDAGFAVDGGFYAMGPPSGNTLDCREYHLGNALSSTALQQVHCPHPGPSPADSGLPCHM
jgi:hypothetical protein